MTKRDGHAATAIRRPWCRTRLTAGDGLSASTRIASAFQYDGTRELGVDAQKLNTLAETVVRQQRLKKRSPIKQNPLPQAGESTRQMLHDLLVEKMMFWIVSTSMFVVITFVEWLTWLRQKPVHPGFMTGVAILVTAVAAYKVWRAWPQANRLHLGLQGELAVGEVLEVLRAHGYRVFHDLPGIGFNVDHIIVGPGGVFVIETKAISKPMNRDATITYDGQHVLIDGHKPDRDPIKQVRACRDFVIEILEKSGMHNPKARAAVVYPGWYIEKQPRGVEVWVLTPKALHSFVLKERSMLTPDDVAESPPRWNCIRDQRAER